ncbi:MAG: preprotein translocase subunit SecG [Christensenellales bacterium]|jgi:protein translocase SecG subunit
MEVIKIILRVLLLVVCLGLTVLVLLQKGSDGASAAIIGGINEGSSARSKGKDELYARYTKIAAVVTFVLCVASTLLDKLG